MVVRFMWRSREWREAHLLATTDHEQTAGPVPMAFLIAGMTAVGGIGDLCRALQGDRDAILHDRLLPMLALVCGLCLAVGAMLALLRKREYLRNLPALPQGEQQVTLHEQGWAAAAGTNMVTKAKVRGWSELREKRKGRHVLTLLMRDGSAVGLPLRALTEDQDGWLERLLLRKMPRMV